MKQKYMCRSGDSVKMIFGEKGTGKEGPESCKINYSPQTVNRWKVSNDGKPEKQMKEKKK